MTQLFKPGTGNETVVQVDATAANETIILPNGFAAGRKFTIRRVDSGASGHTVTVTVPSGQSLDGTVDGSFTVPANGEGWLTPTDPGVWESFGLRNSLVTVDSDGSLVVDGTTVEVGSDAEIASALALKLDTTTATTTYTPMFATPAASTSLTGTLAASTLTSVDCTAGAVARTLPAASSLTAGQSVGVKKSDTSANALVITRTGSDLIFGTGAGSTTKTLTLAGEAVELVSNGVNKWTVKASDTPSGVLATTYGPAVGSDNWLKAWGSNIDALIRATTITRDSNDAATAADVIWPDGTAGAYVGTASVGTPGAIDSYTVTYLGATTKTVTQPTMTRNATGAVTTRPALTVA